MTECIFCGGECTCSSGAPATRKKNKTTKSKLKSNPPALATGSSTSLPTPVKKLEHAALDTSLSQEDLDYRACMRVLAPILCEEDRGKIAHITNTDPTHEEQVYSLTKERAVEKERIDEAWRARGTAE